MTTKISISDNGIWAGDGDLRDGVIENCPAVLGGSQDAADRIYEAIEDAIDNRDDSIEIDGHTYSWAIERSEEV